MPIIFIHDSPSKKMHRLNLIILLRYAIHFDWLFHTYGLVFFWAIFFVKHNRVAISEPRNE